MKILRRILHYNNISCAAVGIILFFVSSFVYSQGTRTMTHPELTVTSSEFAEYVKLDHRISRILQLTDEKIQSDDWSSANALLQEGLGMLEYKYSYSSFENCAAGYGVFVIDDTGEGIALADIEEDNGNLKSAVELRRSTLNERHDMLKAKINLMKVSQ